MTSKGFALLESIIKSFGTDIIDCVITTQDKSIQNDFYNDIRKVCSEKNIRCFDRTESYSLNSDYSFAIAWRWLIQLSDTSKLIVFHDSILPRYRGFAPLVNSLINRESEIGVTALYASDSYDCGDIIGQLKTSISYPLKIEEAIEINNNNYINLAKSIISNIVQGVEINAIKQVESEATYSLWRDEEDYKINWLDSSENIEQFIYAVGYPYKGAFSLMDGKGVRILDAEMVNDVNIENRTPGKVIFVEKGFPVIVCGNGLLKIKKVISEDGKDLIPINRFRIRFK